MNEKPEKPLARWLRKLDPLGLTDPQRPVGMTLFGVLALIMVVADQVTKYMAVIWLRDGPPVEIVPGHLRLIFRTNTGAAFSTFSGQTSMLALVSVIISVILIFWAIRLPDQEKGYRIPLGLILGGAIGNLIDRVWLGEVIDFIDAHWRYQAHWPTFNIADSAVCVGMFLLIVANIRQTLAQPETAPEPLADQPVRDKSSS